MNCTPDSFSDGGKLSTLGSIVDRAHQAVDQGAQALDIGGESTRPGASRIDADEQIRRVVPAIRAIRDEGIAVPMTIDTTIAGVAQAALDAGADAINDVSGGTEDPAMISLASDRGCGIILMHRLVPPDQDQFSDRYAVEPVYADVVETVRLFFMERIEACLSAGIERSRIMLDPGLGFGKSVEQNLELIGRAEELTSLGFPLLSGASRKSFVGRITHARDSDPSERISGSIGCSIVHLLHGARFFRVHDVAAHRQALDAAWSIINSLNEPRN